MIKEAIEYLANAWREVDKITIANCWQKTGIFPADEQDINLAIQIQTSAAEQVEQIVDDLVIDFTKQISPTHDNSEELTSNLTEFLNTFQQDIITEESLNDHQIIELVMEEAREKER